MTDEQVLCARAIDRAIRPLFPPGFCQETHVRQLRQAHEAPMLLNTMSALLTTAAQSVCPFCGHALNRCVHVC